MVSLPALPGPLPRCAVTKASARNASLSSEGVGYDLSQAVAHVVDNSIEGRATIVALDIDFDGVARNSSD